MFVSHASSMNVILTKNANTFRILYFILDYKVCKSLSDLEVRYS